MMKVINRTQWFASFTPMILFLSCLAIFIKAPLTDVSDSKYALLVSQSMLDHGTVQLDRYLIKKDQLPELPSIELQGYPYQIESVNHHLFYYFPPGSSILSIPFVAVANQFGVFPIKSEDAFGTKAILNYFNVSPINSNDDLSIEGEAIIQRVLAAVLMSGTALIMYCTARLFLSFSWSLLTVCSGAFGTSIFSTASRGLWSHTWSIFLLSIILYHLLERLQNGNRIRPIVLATLLSWLYFIRPTNAISIIAVTLILAIYFNKKDLMAVLLTGAVWLALFIGYSLHFYDQWLPNYYLAQRLGSTMPLFLEALAGNLVSPSRGFFIYTPFMLWVIFLLVRYNRYTKYKPLIFMSILAILLHYITISTFPHWWGGYSYGPRLMIDIVPWCIVLEIIGITALLSHQHQTVQSIDVGNHLFNKANSLTKIVQSLGVFTIILSIFLHSRGAFSPETQRWNSYPTSIDAHPGRLWDWQYPQFLAGIIGPPLSEKQPNAP